MEALKKQEEAKAAAAPMSEVEKKLQLQLKKGRERKAGVREGGDKEKEEAQEKKEAALEDDYEQFMAEVKDLNA